MEGTWSISQSEQRLLEEPSAAHGGRGWAGDTGAVTGTPSLWHPGHLGTGTRAERGWALFVCWSLNSVAAAPLLEISQVGTRLLVLTTAALPVRLWVMYDWLQGYNTHVIVKCSPCHGLVYFVRKAPVRWSMKQSVLLRPVLQRAACAKLGLETWNTGDGPPMGTQVPAAVSGNCHAWTSLIMHRRDLVSKSLMNLEITSTTCSGQPDWVMLPSVWVLAPSFRVPPGAEGTASAWGHRVCDSPAGQVSVAVLQGNLLWDGGRSSCDTAWEVRRELRLG